VEVFDPETRSFVPGAGRLRVARANHTATLLPAGDVLIAGGDDGSAPTAHTEIVGPPGADREAPRSRASLPLADSTHVPLNTIVGMRFSKALRASTGLDGDHVDGRGERARVVGAGIVFVGPDGLEVDGTTSSGAQGFYAFFVPSAPLAPGTAYAVRARDGEDLAGNPLEAAELAFTSAPSRSSAASARRAALSARW
jgi:hypothetical protein